MTNFPSLIDIYKKRTARHPAVHWRRLEQIALVVYKEPKTLHVIRKLKISHDSTAMGLSVLGSIISTHVLHRGTKLVKIPMPSTCRYFYCHSHRCYHNSLVYL